MGEDRLTVLTRLRERAIRSFWTIDRVDPSKRDFTSQFGAIMVCESKLKVAVPENQKGRRGQRGRGGLNCKPRFSCKYM